jgi:hypothetical protein
MKRLIGSAAVLVTFPFLAVGDAKTLGGDGGQSSGGGRLAKYRHMEYFG